jgi:hypothetical protein
MQVMVSERDASMRSELQRPFRTLQLGRPVIWNVAQVNALFS